MFTGRKEWQKARRLELRFRMTDMRARWLRTCGREDDAFAVELLANEERRKLAKLHADHEARLSACTRAAGLSGPPS